DAFGTRQPFYSRGNFVSAGSFSGGGLQVVLGGVDDVGAKDLSGGWRRSFKLPSSQFVTVSFDFNLTQTPDYESDEFSDMLSQIDNQPAVVQAHIVGDGRGGTPQSTGQVSRTLQLGCLPPGLHSLTLGARNNKKTLSSESTTLLLDNITVKKAGPCR